MGLTPVLVFACVWFGFSMIDGCFSMAISTFPSTTAPTSVNTTTDFFSNETVYNNTEASYSTSATPTTKLTRSLPTHILRVRIRVHNSLIETLVNQKQLDLIEIQLRKRHIPFRQISDNKDGITIIIGPFHKSTNLTATMMMFNQSRFHTNFSRLLPIQTSSYNLTQTSNSTDREETKKFGSNHYPVHVEAQEYDLAHDQESYEFRNCLEACEIYQDNELKPDHNCIRKKCLKDITGI